MSRKNWKLIAQQIPRGLDRALSVLLKAPARRHTKRNQESGRIDRKRLHLASGGFKRVFRRQHDVAAVNTACMVIVDQTTSMRTGRIHPSVAFASRIKASAQRVGAQCVVAGFSNDSYWCPELRLYCDATERATDALWNRMIADVDGVRSSIAGILMHAGKIVRGMQAGRHVIVLLTDGMEGTHAREAGRILESWGVQVITIGIDVDVEMDRAVNIDHDTLSTKGLERVITDMAR